MKWNALYLPNDILFECIEAFKCFDENKQYFIYVRDMFGRLYMLYYLFLVKPLLL